MLLIAKLGVIAGALSAALVVAACGGGGTQRTGGAPARGATVLKLATFDGNADQLQPFIDQVAKLSKGRLRIEPSTSWRYGQTRFENGLIRDVRAGKADLGWVGSRALASVGVMSFEPLHAPFLIDSYDLERQVLAGRATERMLAELSHVGLAGVAVLPGPLWYLQLDREIDGPAGLAGLRLGYYDSPLQREALAALGAEPVAIPANEHINHLNGVESGVGGIYGNGYFHTTKYTIADTPLWPRPLVVFANAKAWTKLPASDRDTIRKAAEKARAGILAAVRRDDQVAVKLLCKAGTRMVELGDDGQARMRQAVAPLLAKLRSDPATRRTMAEIDTLRGASRPDALRCPVAASPQTAALTGEFEATIRKSDKGSHVTSDFADNGVDAIKNKLELSDGRAVITQYLPSGPVNGFNFTYSVFKDVIKFGDGVSAHWTLDGDRLRFTDVNGPAGDKFVWARSWTKTR